RESGSAPRQYRRWCRQSDSRATHANWARIRRLYPRAARAQAVALRRNSETEPWRHNADRVDRLVHEAASLHFLLEGTRSPLARSIMKTTAMEQVYCPLRARQCFFL